MSELRTIVPKPERALLSESGSAAPEDPKQRRLMLGSLCLLLLALGIVLWHDRDFWFPETPEAESDQSAENSPIARKAPAQPTAVSKPAPPGKTTHHVALHIETPAPSTPALSTPVPPVAITARTVLPPLDVEVVAGDTHRTIRPGSSSVHVELQPGVPAEPIREVDATSTESAANVTSNTAERVQMSADASEIVTHPVRPNYPLLARQMKVQGSVILLALIGKDGIIQNLRVVSGPRILASAAQDAVRRWRFKPHLQDSEAVETQAQITVNFTISTN